MTQFHKEKGASILYTIGNGGGTISDVEDAGSIRGRGVRVNPEVVTIDIAVDINDCELLYGLWYMQRDLGYCV